MPILGVTEAYATVSQADLYLENIPSWVAATDEDKADALLYARYYIDNNFSCIDITDDAEVPEELQFANSLVASDYIVDNEVLQSGANLKRELVIAGSVTSENEYFNGATNKPPSLGIIKGVLKDICSFSKTSTFLIRS